MQVKVLHIDGSVRFPLLLNCKRNGGLVPVNDGKRGRSDGRCSNDLDCFDIILAGRFCCAIIIDWGKAQSVTIDNEIKDERKSLLVSRSIPDINEYTSTFISNGFTNCLP